MTDPSILYFDIETLPMLIPVFRLGKQRVDYTQILKRTEVMCISWAWNDAKVEHAIFDLKKYNYKAKDDDADFRIIRDFSKMASEAELVVGQNVKYFDIGTLVSRIVKYQLPPIAPVLVDDTYALTKGILFASHKQDDLGDFLGYGKKADHGKGMDWWIKIMQGDTTTLNKMVKYCDMDVVRLRQIYKHLKPYIKSSLNAASYSENNESCRSCGSKSLERRGFHRTRVGKYQRFQCKDCGAWSVSGTNLIKGTGKILR